MSLPGWILVVLAGFAAVAAVVAIIRGSNDGPTAQMVQTLVVLALALGAGWALGHVFARDRGSERLEARALDLTARALAPGSPLACLNGIAGEAVEEACEKALFATAESTAAAVSYVAAQLALLAAGGASVPQDQKATGMLHASLRRAIESDRFGIVAHVLAVRGGCTPNHCEALALLHDSTRVKTNLVRRPFEARMAKHMAGWPLPASPGATSEPLAAELSAAPGAVLRPNNRDLYFPSAESIPPVNIMTAEPAQRQPSDTSGEAATAPRKPSPPAVAPPRQPPPSSRSEPLKLAPNTQ